MLAPLSVSETSQIMIAAMRRHAIYEEICEKKSGSVSKLARDFSVTEETIRRDLKELEAQGLVLRSYGGAFIQDGVENLVDINVREGAYIPAKQAIARTALQFIRNGDTIFLDNSTTAGQLAQLIKNMRLTVLTNNLGIMNTLSQSSSIHLLGLGGDFSYNEQAFYGDMAVRDLCNYFVDASFISCRSISLENGITDSTERWTRLRQEVIHRSNRSYVIADHTKFGRTSFMSVCGFDHIQAVITDEPLPAQWSEELSRLGCNLVVGDDICVQDNHLEPQVAHHPPLPQKER